MTSPITPGDCIRGARRGSIERVVAVSCDVVYTEGGGWDNARAARASFSELTSDERRRWLQRRLEYGAQGR